MTLELYSVNVIRRILVVAAALEGAGVRFSCGVPGSALPVRRAAGAPSVRRLDLRIFDA